MCMTRLFTSSILSLLVFFSLSYQAQAADSLEQASNMFIFQQKLANKGNAKAQYNIAFMYETGDGIKQDLVKAKAWYEQAAVKNDSAVKRLSYLQIRESGFKKDEHSAWLKSVKREALTNKSESLFLLAQIYQHGLGVKKDLNKALELMYRLGAEGLVEADQQVLVIEKELLAINKKRNKAKKVAAEKKQTAVALQKQKDTVWKKDVVSSVIVASTVPVQVQALAEEIDVIADEKAKKRARYEAVMQQLAEEQAELDRLQESVSDDELASIEDEI